MTNRYLIINNKKADSADKLTRDEIRDLECIQKLGTEQFVQAFHTIEPYCTLGFLSDLRVLWCELREQLS
jgi:hypothetical protein